MDEKKHHEHRRGDQKHRGRRRSRRDQPPPPVRAPDPAMAELLAAPIDQSKFIVFDIETTGGNPEKNGITEIFAIRYESGEVKDTFYSLVNPGIPIPPIVRRMTGINNQMVRGAPKIDAVMPDFVKFAQNDVLVSHNTIGDMKFIRHFAKKCCDVDFDNFFLCTHLLVEKLAHEAPDKSLKGLAEFFKLKHEGELHRAEADAYLTLELFKVLVGRLKQRSVSKIDAAIRLQGDLESGMRLGWGVKDLGEVPQGPGVFKLFDHEKKLLFLSSAVQLDREVHKLHTFQQLPRQLLRIVLRTYEVGTTRSANAFAAMLDECDAMQASKVHLHPSDWHQRTVQALFLAEGPDGTRLDVGSLEAGTQFAFGPVRDRRIAGELIGAIGKAVGSAHHKYGIALNAQQKALVLTFLQGGLEGEYEAVARRRRSVKLWFKPSQRKLLTQQLSAIQELLAIKSKMKLAPLLDRNGILVLPDKLNGGWQLYELVNSRPRELTAVRGDFEAKLRQAGLARRLAEKITAERDAENAAGSTLTQVEADRANATLWWLYNGRGEGRFVALDELAAMVDGPVPAASNSAPRSFGPADPQPMA